MRAINTRDIETPYIISNSYQIPYIIRENPGEGEILMHSRLNGVSTFLSTAYLQLYNTMQLESFDDSVPKIRAVSVVQDITDFLFNETERAIPSSDLSSYVTEESSILNGELAARLPSSRGRGRG